MNCYGIIIVHNRVIARDPVIARDFNHIRREKPRPEALNRTKKANHSPDRTSGERNLAEIFPATCGESEHKVPPTLPTSGRALGMTNTVGIGALASLSPQVTQPA